MIRAALRTRALADATLSGLIGTRMYAVKLPQSPTYPAVTFSRVSGPRIYTHEGETGLAEGRFQFDVWAASQSLATEVADALRGALEGYSGTTGGVEIASIFVIGEQDGFDPQEGDTGDHRVSMDLWVRYYES